MESRIRKILKEIASRYNPYNKYRVTHNPFDYDDSTEYENYAFEYLLTKYAVKVKNGEEHAYVMVDPNNDYSTDNDHFFIDNVLTYDSNGESRTVFDTKEEAELVLNAYNKAHPEVSTEVIPVYLQENEFYNSKPVFTKEWYEDWEDAFPYEQYQEEMLEY